MKELVLVTFIVVEIFVCAYGLRKYFLEEEDKEKIKKGNSLSFDVSSKASS